MNYNLKVIKCDGRIAPWDDTKITAAILKAWESVYQGHTNHQRAWAEATIIAERIRGAYSSTEKPAPVESIQDQVEIELMHSSFFTPEVAKHYILYRDRRTLVHWRVRPTPRTSPSYL